MKAYNSGISTQLAANEVYSTSEAAEVLGVSLRTIQQWVDGGILEAWKTVGGHRRVSRASVEALLKGKNSSTSPAGKEYEENGGFHLGYQPILTADGRIFGYELLYRSRGMDSARFADPLLATSRVIEVAFGELGFLGAVGDAHCFINIEEEMLYEDLLMVLVPERIVLELPANVVPTDRLIDRCVYLKRAGFKLLLENYRPDESPERMVAVADYLKIDLRSSREILLMASQLRNLSGQVKLVGGRVESEEAYNAAQRLGCDYFQGFYFAKPTLARGKQIPPQKVALLEILRLVLGDADSGEIEKRLKLEPALCYSLLRLVNSAGSGLARRIDTLQEVILVLGRKNLLRWVQLLLYAHEDQFAQYPNPLMQSAAFRGRFLECLVAILPGQQARKERAFMVGILSHVEALLKVPMAQVLPQLNLAEDVERALLYREGLLGGLLTLVESLDDCDFERASQISEELRLDQDDMHRGLVESLRWSNALGRVG